MPPIAKPDGTWLAPGKVIKTLREEFMDGRTTAITAVSAGGSSPTTITLADLPPGFWSGCTVIIAGAGGSTAVNGVFTATKTGWNTITIPVANSTAWTSGGTVQVFSNWLTLGATAGSAPTCTYNNGTGQQTGQSVKVSTDAVAGHNVSLNFPAPQQDTRLRGIFATVEGLMLDASATSKNADFNFAMYPLVYLEQIHNASTGNGVAQLLDVRTSATWPLNYNIVDDAGSSRTLTLAVVPNPGNTAGEIWVFEGDPLTDPSATPINWWPLTSAQWQYVTAINLTLTTQSAAIRSLTFSRASLSVVCF